MSDVTLTGETPPNVIKIAPSILAADFKRLGDQVVEAQAAGADLIHIDVMDGRFVPNITMGPLVVEAVAQVASIPLDAHLMIVEPDRFIRQFADSGADIISVHVEACPHLHRVLQEIVDLGCRAGVALNPHTPASALGEVIGLVDTINVMTVNPGFGGQRFIGGMTRKLRQLRDLALDAGADVEIEVDGGINSDTIAEAMAAGATVAIAGSSVFQHDAGIAAGITELRCAATRCSSR